MNILNKAGFGLLLCLVLVIQGCDSDSNRQDGNSVLLEERMLHSLTCELVRTAVATRERPILERFQQRLVQSDMPRQRRLRLLEQLGWRHIELARESFDAGHLKLAEQTARCMDSLEPGSHAALLLLGVALHRQHRFAEAESLARLLVSERGAWFDHALMGDLRLEQGNMSGARDAYQKMMDLHPGPQAYSRTAEWRWLNGDRPGAVSMMALSVRSTSPRQPEAKAWALCRLAHYLWLADDGRHLYPLLQAAFELSPDYPPALLLLGRLQLAQGHYRSAAELLRHAAQQVPEPLYQWPLVEALELAGQPERAEALRQRMARDGSRTDRRSYALYLATTTDNPRALSLAQSEYRVRQDPVTLDTLAIAYWRQGQLDQAWPLVRRAMQWGGAEPRLHLHAGLIADARGDCDRATRWLAWAWNKADRLLPSELRLLDRAGCPLPPGNLELPSLEPSGSSPPARADPKPGDPQ